MIRIEGIHTYMLIHTHIFKLLVLYGAFMIPSCSSAEKKEPLPLS